MLVPIGKRIIIQPVEEKSGILLVSNKHIKLFNVIAIGDEVTKVRIGDDVYLEKHYGIEIDYEKGKYLVVDEGSILAKIE